MSETGKIAEALAAFQAEAPIVKKAHTAKVPTKAGGSYSYTYAGLADVSEAAMPILASHGLAFSCCPGFGERGYELRGRLLHTSGEEITGSLPIAGNTAQEMGSSLTYMRRYLLGCMTGLVTDDDDDGQLAQSAKPRAKPSGKPPATTPGQMTEPTRKRLFAMFTERGITDRDEQIRGIVYVIGREIESRSDLTEDEARSVCDTLKAHAPEATP